MNKKIARPVLVIALAALIATLVNVPGVQARLALYTPEQTVTKANLVLVGTVNAVQTGKAVNSCDIKIEKVLKGKLVQKTIRVTARSSALSARLKNVFPPRGSRVFIAVNKESKYYRPVGDRNAIALIEKGHVAKIHLGSRVIINKKSWQPASYAKYYDAYYQKGMTVIPEPVKKEDLVTRFYYQKQDGQTVRINSGEKIEVQLPSNPSTGFKWAYVQEPDSAIISVAEKFYEPASSTVPLVGAGGTQAWTIKGLKDGAAVLSVAYSRPWESVQPAKTFKLYIIVGEANPLTTP